MKNKKHFRWLVGGALAVVFPIQFLLVGMVNAELLNKDIPNSYTFRADTLKNLRQIDLGSFWGKPVKIPFMGDNPDGVPGADQDLAIIFPPRILDKNASIPLRAIYFSSGKAISVENANFANKLELLVNSVGNNNPVMLEVIKNIIESNQQMSLNTDNCSSLACYLPALLKLARAETSTDSTDLSNSSTLLNQDDLSQLTDSLKDMDTSNPQVKQLLTLVLLLMTNSQSMAQSLNTDKQDCLDMGGDWSNGACQNQEKTTCEENGGTFKKLLNSCAKDKLTCGNEDLTCSSEKEVDDSGNALSIYGCACKSGSCLDDNGNCVGQNKSKKKVCQNSGGTWREFSDPQELCQQKCDATSTSCASAGSSSASAKAQMGCDCSSATNSNTNVNWSQPGTSTSPPKMCLSADGGCTAKDTCKDDDDKDGVPNCQDKCANSTPDGSGTVNMQAGTQYQGCTCSQIQAMGGIPKQQPMQCPPDGCEEGTPYMVQYDRSQLNNQQQQQTPQCQNGIAQQQQQQQQQMQVSQYGTTGTYSACPVLSRQPTQQCQDDMDRRNNSNDNMNKKMDDLLKQLKDQQKKQDQQQKNQGNQGNNGTQPGNNTQQQQQQNQNDNKLKEQQQLGLSAAIDPKGPGEFNKSQNGTPAKPYALHASQFKKVCGENTYQLVTAKPGGGDFKNDPSKPSPGDTPGKLGVPDINPLGTAPCKQPVCKDRQPLVKEAHDLINSKWKKLSQEDQDAIIKIKDGNGDPYQKLLDIISKLKSAKEVSATPLNPSGGKPAKTMKDLMEDKGAYFKIPTCQELAKTHCCVCSCCDKPDKQCGWTIGMKCNTTGDKGSCDGEKCAMAPTSCSEKPELSIKLDWGNDFKQCSNKGGDPNAARLSTSQEKCSKYTLSTHNEGACRYDCNGSPVGCEEPGSDQCTIILNGKDIRRFEDGRWPNCKDISPDQNQAQFTEFQNKKEGSVVQILGTQDPRDADWIKVLDTKDGQACKCQERDKSKQNPPNMPGGFEPLSADCAGPAPTPPPGPTPPNQQIQLPPGIPGPIPTAPPTSQKPGILDEINRNMEFLQLNVYCVSPWGSARCNDTGGEPKREQYDEWKKYQAGGGKTDFWSWRLSLSNP